MWPLLLAACVPVLDDPTPYVDGPRLLAVAATPAEVSPGDPVRLDALYVDVDGPVTAPALAWALCTQPKPLAELGPVAPSCLDPGSEDLVAVGEGDGVDATAPIDACSRFGPNPPPPVDGVAGRPTDPDVTGGYYQPVVAFDDGDPTLAALRLRCGLANVAQEIYIDWNRRYRANAAPRITALEADGVPVDDRIAAAAGAPLTLSVAWPACPEVAACGDGVCSADEDATACPADCAAPVPCEGAETYVVLDPASGALVTRREAISATWFATGGSFAAARNGVGADDDGTAVTNTWTPDGDGWLWVVLRDDRGGVSWRGWAVDAE